LLRVGGFGSGFFASVSSAVLSLGPPAPPPSRPRFLSSLGPGALLSSLPRVSVSSRPFLPCLFSAARVLWWVPPPRALSSGETCPPLASAAHPPRRGVRKTPPVEGGEGRARPDARATGAPERNPGREGSRSAPPKGFAPEKFAVPGPVPGPYPGPMYVPMYTPRLDAGYPMYGPSHKCS
jgi:hypothetical protein